MLQVNNLVKNYVDGKSKFLALNSVSVTVNKGEIFGFIGLSGAGKTSLARCVAALETADSGEILFNNQDITKLKGKALRETRKQMGFVFQHFNLLMNATIFENIAFPLRIAKMPPAEINARVTELLEVVGLADKRNAYPKALSGGQKQRVGIARALAPKPQLIICDEATSALDPDTTKSILALLKEISQKTGVTLLVITHEMDVIRDLCTHVAVMEGGNIIETGPVLEVLTNPKTDTAKRFFSKEYIDQKWLKDTTPPGTSHKICRATFIDKTARKPFINQVIREFPVEISILSGNIENVGGTMVGSLVLEINGPEDIIANVLEYFRANNVSLEVIDHV